MKSSVSEMKNLDIYFDDNYGKLYEKIEGGKFEVFYHKSELGIVKHQFIRRKIEIELDGHNYYDLITPYGYGGPIILECDQDRKKELILNFFEAFSTYCKENKIISEFVRFHPIVNNAIDFQEIYNILCIRKTLGTNLRDFDNPVQSEFSKSCRQKIRKALNNGVTFEIYENPSNIGEFKEIYYSTMNRNNADDFYYFDDEYFNNLISHFQNNIVIVKAIFENKVIAQGLYLIFGKYIHIHLSGTLTDYLYLSPANILRYAITIWGKENGYEMIHHGGGTSNSTEDGLYRFKKNFAKNTEFDFYIGKKIWDNDKYLDLCNKLQIDSNIEFFPAYRYKKIGD